MPEKIGKLYKRNIVQIWFFEVFKEVSIIIICKALKNKFCSDRMTFSSLITSVIADQISNFCWTEVKINLKIEETVTFQMKLTEIPLEAVNFGGRIVDSAKDFIKKFQESVLFH